MRRFITAAVLLAVTLAGSAAHASADVPPGKGHVSDAAMFDSVVCAHAGAVVAGDVIETRGGGASVWLPSGEHLVAVTFQLVDQYGNLVSDEHYGVKTGLRTADPYVCTATGTDPAGSTATGILTAYPAP